MDLFGKSSRHYDPETAAKIAAGKISNGTALLVRDLAKEPSKGLLQVVSHVQKSVPGLLETHRGLEAATAQLQVVLEELQDAQEGICSITSPATEQDLNALAASLDKLHELHMRQQQHWQHTQSTPSMAAADAAAASGSSSSSLKKSLVYPALWRGS